MVIFVLAVFIGLEKPIYGAIVGLLVSIGYCFLARIIDIHLWFFYPIIGMLLGFLSPISVRWLFSGLRGGRGKTEPGVTYIGGFGVGRAGQYFGKWSEGIIPSEDEETGWRKNKSEKRERWIGILIRYLSAPIILLLTFIAIDLLN